MARADAKLPVTVLTGFLGSGKTTLLKRILAAPDMAGTAVLINEFGEIGLDHLLVREVHGNAIVLQNGCICCALQGDLRQGLRDLIDSRAAKTTAPFDRIVIETTGLADPAPILRMLVLDPMLKNQVRLAQCVATVDALHGGAQLRTHGEASRQAAAADRLVMTKGDLAPPDAVRLLTARVRAINPTAPLLDVQAPAFDPRRLILEGLHDTAARTAEVQRWFRLAARGAPHLHDEGADEGEAGHAAGVRSFSLRIEEAIDWTAFGVWLTSLLHRHGPNVLRVKGLLNVSDALGPVVLHGVQSVIHAPVHLADWPDADRSSRLIFIVQDIDPARVRRSLFAFLAAARGEAAAAPHAA